MLELSTDRH